MSICTKRGDKGHTDLMFSKRVSKTDPRVEACGAADELNAVLGIVRNSNVSDEMKKWVDEVQRRLVGLMGVIATHEDDHDKYADAGYTGIEPEDVAWLEALISEAETEKGIKFKGWARPGEAGAMAGAYLDLARTVCRRAERSLWSIDDDFLATSRLFMNRLSDALWLVARNRENG